MAKLIYSMLMSLDGYTEDEQGDFSWARPGEDVFSFITELTASVRTYLYGRKMYEMMAYWETAHTLPDQPEPELAWARQWQAAEKIVYSKTLSEPKSARTRIEREFDPLAVRRLKDEREHDLAIDGPELAGQAVKAGLVDEFQLIVCPVIVGGGKRFFPRGAAMKLELLEDRRFKDGTVFMRYAVRD